MIIKSSFGFYPVFFYLICLFCRKFEDKSIKRRSILATNHQTDFSPLSHHHDRDSHPVTYRIDRLAPQQIAQQAVAVRAHDQHIHLVRRCKVD